MARSRGAEPVVGRELVGEQEDLIERIRRGDPRAFDTLAREQAPYVERLLRRILGSRADMDDLVQEVFLETCRALPRFRGDSKISTFIGGITVRVAKRAMTPNAWKRRRAAMELPDVESAAAGPERLAEADEQLKRVHRALEAISPKKRIAFMLWALDGMEPKDIAKMTGASLSATRSRIFYAQKELRKRALTDPYLRSLVEDDDADPQ